MQMSLCITHLKWCLLEKISILLAYWSRFVAVQCLNKLFCRSIIEHSVSAHTQSSKHYRHTTSENQYSWPYSTVIQNIKLPVCSNKWCYTWIYEILCILVSHAVWVCSMCDMHKYRKISLNTLECIECSVHGFIILLFCVNAAAYIDIYVVYFLSSAMIFFFENTGNISLKMHILSAYFDTNYITQ